MIPEESWQRQALFAGSLANLWMLPTWSALLPFAVGMRTHELAKPTREDYVAALIVYAILAVIIFAITATIRRATRPAIRWIAAALLLCSLVIPVNLVRTLGGALSIDVITGSGRMLWAVAAIVAIGAAVFRNSLARAATAVVLVLCPLAALTLAEAAWGAATIHASRDYPESVTPSSRPPDSSRVVVVTFDEWDYGATFERRPGDLQLPQIDRFDQDAFHAAAAYSPAKSTLLSILAVLTQRPVAAAQGRADGGVDAVIDDRSVSIESTDVLFTRLRAAGVRNGVVGWAVPYCHVFHHVVDQCRQLDHGVVFRRPTPLWSRVARQFRNLMPWYGKQSFVAMVRESVTHAERMAADSTLDMVWLHLPGPHLPVFYDRSARDYTMFKFNAARGYFDNLAWVDDTLGRLRASMEQSGVWDRTHVILTSDHSWSASKLADGSRDPRVPVLIKLAGRQPRVSDAQPFNTMAIADVVPQLLRTGNATPDDLGRWLHGSAVSALTPLAR